MAAQQQQHQQKAKEGLNGRSVSSDSLVSASSSQSSAMVPKASQDQDPSSSSPSSTSLFERRTKTNPNFGRVGNLRIKSVINVKAVSMEESGEVSTL